MAPSAAIDTCGNAGSRRVCFSFAAYAKTVIGHLKSCNVPVAQGLTESEFAAIESAFNFSFPPDLRSILQEGLPTGLGFPNWRSSSQQQLEILVRLPISGLLNEISRSDFWCESWGPRPERLDEALSTAKVVIGEAPALVPIYQNCYISSRPHLAGNPVFFVRGGVFRYSSFDVAGFFAGNSVGRGLFGCWSPAWAAKAARRIEFWSDLVEAGDGEGRTCGWWEVACDGRAVTWAARVAEMRLRLRTGGWSDKDVREMLDGEEAPQEARANDRDAVVWHVRLLSLTLLRAGWAREDVTYALGPD